jgi:phosphoribosylglycinamide formyltransferase-1
MPKRSARDPRLIRLTEIVRALPETSRKDLASHVAFLVRKKIFAYFLNDHHGDGIVALTCKALSGENSALIAAQPTCYYMSAYIGPKGWVALRLDLGKIDWDEVCELLLGSYLLTAPKKTRRVGQSSLVTPYSRKDFASPTNLAGALQMPVCMLLR